MVFDLGSPAPRPLQAKEGERNSQLSTLNRTATPTAPLKVSGAWARLSAALVGSATVLARVRDGFSRKCAWRAVVWVVVVEGATHG